MSKHVITSALLASVLASGLSGCGKKETEKDVFSVPGPRIVRAGEGDSEFKAWSEKSDRALDLQDAFDVSAGSPARAEIKTSCRVAGKEFSQTFAFASPRNLKIYSFIPEEVFTRAIADQAQCGFDLTLSNEAGSRHIFSIAAVPLIDEQPTTLTFFDFATSQSIDRTNTGFIQTPDSLKGLQARRQGLEATEARLSCRDGSTDTVAFNQFLDLEKIDLSTMSVRASRPPNSLLNYPVQSCRLTLWKDGNIADLGPLFTLALPVQSPATKLTDAPYRLDQLNPLDWQRIYIDKRQIDNPMLYSSVRLTNTSNATRSFRVWKTGPGLIHSFYLNYVTGSGPHMSKAFLVHRMQSSNLVNEASIEGLSAIAYADEFFDVTVPSGHSFSVQSIFRTASPANCRYQAFYTVQADSNLRVQEISAEGELSNAFEINLGSAVVFSPGADLKFQNYREVTGASIPPGC